MKAHSGLWCLRLIASGVAVTMLSLGFANALAANKSSGGRTVTFAEQPEAPPNYIFPLESPTYCDSNNYAQFSELLWRPLYWFGSGSQPILNKALSVALPPVFSDNNTVATVTLKHWVWSDGAPVTARDVIFWMNLLSAVTDPNAPAIGSTSAPGPTWCDAVPAQFPVNLVSYTQTGTYSVAFHFNSSYNPSWVLYDELSQIFPIPQQSWDRLSSSGPVGNFDTSAQARVPIPNTSPTQYIPQDEGTATSGALGVAQFLNSQSQDISTYQSNPLWETVDGPFRLSQFTPSGYVKMVPNPHYSGTDKATVSSFQELPYTSEAAEFDALRAGTVDIGYLPVQYLSQKTSLEKGEGYSYNLWGQFGYFQMNYNFTNTVVGAVFKQLYFRQAFQSLINQPEYIKQFGYGVGSVENGPVPNWPANNPYESPLEARGQVYPFDPNRAVSLLKDNGWTVVPGGTSYCSKPGSASGECGAGIAADEKASFTMLYGSGSQERTNEMQAMQSTMKSKAGIDLVMTSQPTFDVLGVVFDNCTPATPCNGWELTNYGGPFDYWPNYWPSGDLSFKTGAAYNGGYYSSPVADADIVATDTAPTQAAEIAALFKYEDYMARQLPVVWMPNEPAQLTLYKSDLRGVVPQGAYADEIYPENYRWSG
jgi:peptide/nickel transport system substrate-binding protein